MLSSTFVQSLEEEIDRRGLARVLHDLAGICADKAIHVQDAWQDKPRAKRWAQASAALTAAANAEPIRRIS